MPVSRALLWVVAFGDNPRVIAIAVEPHGEKKGIFGTRASFGKVQAATFPNQDPDNGIFPAPFDKLDDALNAGWRLASTHAVTDGPTIVLLEKPAPRRLETSWVRTPRALLEPGVEDRFERHLEDGRLLLISRREDPHADKAVVDGERWFPEIRQPHVDPARWLFFKVSRGFLSPEEAQALVERAAGARAQRDPCCSEGF